MWHGRPPPSLSTADAVFRARAGPPGPQGSLEDNVYLKILGNQPEHVKGGCLQSWAAAAAGGSGLGPHGKAGLCAKVVANYQIGYRWRR